MCLTFDFEKFNEAKQYFKPSLVQYINFRFWKIKIQSRYELVITHDIWKPYCLFQIQLLSILPHRATQMADLMWSGKFRIRVIPTARSHFYIHKMVIYDNTVMWTTTVNLFYNIDRLPIKWASIKNNDIQLAWKLILTKSRLKCNQSYIIWSKLKH